MKKAYVKPELDLIDLAAKETLMGEPLEEQLKNDNELLLSNNIFED